jgi:hypothetical protein
VIEAWNGVRPDDAPHAISVRVLKQNAHLARLWLALTLQVLIMVCRVVPGQLVASTTLHKPRRLWFVAGFRNAIETAWISAGAEINRTINSTLIAAGVGFSPESIVSAIGPGRFV